MFAPKFSSHGSYTVDFLRFWKLCTHIRLTGRILSSFGSTNFSQVDFLFDFFLLYECLNIWLSRWFTGCLYAYFVLLPDSLTVWLSDCLTSCQYVYLVVSLFNCLAVWLSFCISIWLSGCMPVWLFNSFFSCTELLYTSCRSVRRRALWKSDLKGIK